MRNLHQYYYQKYFEDISFDYLIREQEKAPANVVDKIKDRNRVLTGTEYTNGSRKPNVIPEAPFKDDVLTKIPLEIMYPGLVTGIGTKHETKIEGEFKLGMHFDWTRGMPVVYGSSVKGVLRSAFIAKVHDGKIVKYEDYFLKIVKPDFIWDEKSIKMLFNALFEGKGREGNNIPIYDRDIFFDAVIVEADPKDRILCPDSITPHGDNPLKNPRPLTFVKIAPGCKMEFRFKLNKTEVVNDQGKKICFDEAAKKELFRIILTTVGAGAKTNVGYGQFK